MSKQDRIEQIKKQLEGSLFLVRNENNLFWRSGNYGYTNKEVEARIFGREEIIRLLQNNGLIDKKIEVFVSTASI